MTEQKHRPGPWILSEYEVRHPITLELRKGCEIFCNKNNKVIAEIPDYCFHPEDAEHDKADAKLITAAPKMLAALIKLHDSLKQLNDCGDVGQMVEDYVDIAQAVIAEATQ